MHVLALFLVMNCHRMAVDHLKFKKKIVSS